MTHVVVCIVGFRSHVEVIGCIRSLEQSTHSAFEVVVCENGGAAERDELARLLANGLSGGQAVEVLPYGGNIGYAGGNNRCIEARPEADVWWILNPDTRAEPDAMALLLARLDAADCDAVGGTLCRGREWVQAYGGRWVPLLARAVSIGHGSRYDPAVAVVPLDYILGASVMFTREFLARAGPMREDYFLYGEEVEWCLRAKARGLRLGMEPRAVIHHDQGATTGSGHPFRASPRLLIYLDQRNRVHILRDSKASLRWICTLGGLAAFVARAVRHRAWRQLGYGLSGWLAGVRDERGAPDWVA